MENMISENTELSKEELAERQYKQKLRELLIAQTRASVVRSQIVRAYEILENIRFDFVSDTAFRDKIVKAKRNLESAVNDYLLRDEYWREKIESHNKMTPFEYEASLKMPISQSGKKA